MTSTSSDPEYYPVVGRTGSTYDRLSIQDLQNEAKQFSLFILAFLEIQERDDCSTYSSYLPAPLPGVKAGTFLEIGSIHGKPYKPWAGDGTEAKSDFSYDDPKDTNPVPSRFGGYCNHGSVLFPTWHRPYVLLLEQVIGDRATEIATKFATDDNEKDDDDSGWKTAAKKLRFPFWDWAEKNVKDDGVPEVLYEESVVINVPGNNTATVPNPLAWYPLKEIPSDFTDEYSEGNIAYFKEWAKTLRHPTSDEQATTDTDEMQEVVKAAAEDLRAKVANLFTYDESLGSAKTWDQFSNHQVQSAGPGGVRIGSLEGVHDRVHDLIGGLGHMGFPDYAGLDPIFFLHHCNVDRLYALWEYCYPNDWMDDGWVDDEDPDEVIPWTQNQGTYNEVYSAQILPQTGLAPFRNNDGNYWTSDTARGLRVSANVTPKYYSYPEVAGVKVDRQATIAQRKQYRVDLSKYYGLEPIADKAIVIPIFRNPIEQPPEGYEALPGYRRWVVTVELLEHAYNGPYSFRLTHKFEDSTSEVFLGGVSVFARPDHSECIACSGRRAQGSMVRGVIIIQPNIIKNVIIHDGLNNEGTSSATLTEHLISTLRGELTDPYGRTLGQTRELPATLRAVKHLPRKLAPLNIRLFSSAVDKQKLHWFDWQDHGDVFPHHAWKSAANA